MTQEWNESQPLRDDKVRLPVDINKGLEDTASEAFGELLKHVGEGGKYQWRVFFVASFCGVFFAFNNLSAAFLAATPDFICDFTSSGENAPVFHALNASLHDWNLPQCEYYNIDFIGNSSESNKETELAFSSNLDENKCHSWIYDDSVYKSTVVTEWDLVCDRRYLMSSTQATYMAGVLIGAVVLSELSDMYGRRTVCLASTVGFLISGVAIAFSTDFFMFIILRSFVAFFGSGIFLPNFVLIMEYVGPRQRTYMGMCYQGFFAVGFCLLPGIAYYLRDWRDLQLAISVPSAILLLYFWILPESPLWLLSQGEEVKALKILKKVADVNGRSLPEEKELRELLSKIVSKPSRHSESILGKVANFFKNQANLLRTPILRRRCLIMYFSWFVVSMIYYGLAFSGSNINASVYLMVFLSGIVEIPSYLLACLTVGKFGRRLNISISFFVCGIACMLILAVPKDMVWLNITFASVGKFFNSAAFAIAYIYSAELVPTQVRNIAVGTSSMWARLGSTIAPFIVDSLGQVHYAIPSTVFGILSIMSAFLDLLLPETGKSPLPETIEEVEAMKR